MCCGFALNLENVKYLEVLNDVKERCGIFVFVERVLDQKKNSALDEGNLREACFLHFVILLTLAWWPTESYCSINFS